MNHSTRMTCDVVMVPAGPVYTVIVVLPSWSAYNFSLLVFNTKAQKQQPIHSDLLIEYDLAGLLKMMKKC